MPLNEGELLSLRATTHNTVVPTILRGGHRINVIPSEVSVDIDGRILPGQEATDWLRRVREAVGDEVSVELLSEGSGIAADPASPFYDAIAATIDELDPGSGVLPFLVSGGTDARKLPGIKIYGFMPSRGENPIALAHNHNERTSVDDLLSRPVASTRRCGVSARRDNVSVSRESVNGSWRRLLLCFREGRWFPPQFVVGGEPAGELGADGLMATLLLGEAQGRHMPVDLRGELARAAIPRKMNG